MATVDNKSVLINVIAEFNNKERRDGYFELYASDAVLHRSPPLAPGIDAIKQWYRSLWAAFPDCRLTLGNVVSEGVFVANNFRLTGTHRGPFLGAPASGRPIDVEGVTILRFADGKCVERWSQTDVLGIMRQIGAAVAKPVSLSWSDQRRRWLASAKSRRSGISGIWLPVTSSQWRAADTATPPNRRNPSQRSTTGALAARASAVSS